ncbi:MAG: PHP domain-containing protein [Clostridia bacterium]|nr:PHP domain-containing protein [Clostridia bacterium]
MKKLLSIIMSAVMIFSIAGVAVYAEGQTDYTIVNPYQSVNWATYDTYKANLHTHCNASDGDPTLTEMVEAYYDAGYDILAMTDHGVINYGWNKDRETNGIFNGWREVYPMDEETYQRITTGSDRGGRGMTDITGGIECNMAVISKTHVNGYFTTYGQGEWGIENDYKTATVEIEKAGGYSVLNHVGDWVNSNAFPERSHWDSYIAYFADIFTTSKTCLGMEIVNNTDNVTRADRALWDELLQVVIPTGRNIWVFADDDSEQLYEVGRSFELFPLAVNDEEHVKEAMINGSFFAASRFDKTDKNNEFEGNGLVPIVKSIKVDQKANTISVEVDKSRDCQKIEWIADGKVISEDYTIDLNDFEDELGCYVRFQLHGEGGVTYSQAFELQYEGRPEKPIPTEANAWIHDTCYGKVFNIIYRSIPWALGALIVEKVGILLGLTK